MSSNVNKTYHFPKSYLDIITRCFSSIKKVHKTNCIGMQNQIFQVVICFYVTFKYFYKSTIIFVNTAAIEPLSMTSHHLFQFVLSS